MRLAPLLAVLAALVFAPAASAQLVGLPPPPEPPVPILPLPPIGVLNALPTHGVDPFSIGITVQVPPPAGGPSGAPLDTGVPVDAQAVQRSEPTAWCGDERPTDDAADAASNGDYHYHLIYAVPSDGTDRFGGLASQLQTSAFQASSLIEREYERAIRFDMGTRCGPQYIDISSIRLPQSTADLQSLVTTNNATYSTLIDDLNAAGFPAMGQTQAPSTFTGTSNWVVWLDGPAPAGCGQGTFYPDARRDPANDNDAGGKIAVVFRDGADFCNSNALRHEIGHNLGAVQSQAPHYDGTGHCNDTDGDTMCLSSQPVNPDTFQSLYFDAGDDDYWDPPGGQLGWWTTNLNRFLCPGVACDVPGGVAARTAAPAGIPGAPGIGGAGQTLKLSSSHRDKHWRFKLRVPGTGRARVTVSCRFKRRRHTLLTRTVSLPATLTGHGNCDSRPKASVKRR